MRFKVPAVARLTAANARKRLRAAAIASEVSFHGFNGLKRRQIERIANLKPAAQPRALVGVGHFTVALNFHPLSLNSIGTATSSGMTPNT